ncbi:hypothetical protein [Rhodanobacter sp. 7MK24]|uniref:hypothetical protein n=1 Tax=Rhodanobacter sp. 7MK24 TaxID=2775922 RepID=UPI001CE0BD78|nr:hypothetical protein [Rhodanobacter sp. 7MK24]
MSPSRTRQIARCCTFLMLALVAGINQAADWSDVAIDWSGGERFREPYNSSEIHKNILSLTWVSGYRYGTQFFDLDVLKSDHSDPASPGSRNGAVETYATYRYTLDLGKVADRDLGFGPVRGLGLTGGFDWNMKHDVDYNSRKRMLVLGPSLLWNVPGHFNTAVLMAWESNAPHGPYPPISEVQGRYYYKAHPMLAMDWGIPLGAHWSFEGYANYIAAKGINEIGQATGPETDVDMRILLDAGELLGARKHRFLAGVEYQYWRNKFGNTRIGTDGQGYVANTPMLRMEYHF